MKKKKTNYVESPPPDMEAINKALEEAEANQFRVREHEEALELMGGQQMLENGYCFEDYDEAKHPNNSVLVTLASGHKMVVVRCVEDG